jgi:hypothetical protein
MKKVLAGGFIFLALTLSGTAAGSGPDIRIIDNKVSIQAEAVPLGRFLRLWDQATGMTSKVPPELANRNVNVRFTDLNFDDAVRKIFEGQPVDYVLVAGRGIIVTGTSQILSAKNNSGPINTQPPEPVVDQSPFQQQFQQNGQPGFPGAAGITGAPNGGVAGAQQQPATIQTPFGTIPNPRANPPQQGAVMPGQATSQNPFNNGAPGFNSSNQLPNLQSNPAFGTPTTPTNNSPFNNSPFNNNNSPFNTPAYPSSYPNTVPNNGFPATPTPPRPNP